jgi:ABC-type glycerol-3-phosphate transport system substrate-binding protein
VPHERNRRALLARLAAGPAVLVACGPAGPRRPTAVLAAVTFHPLAGFSSEMLAARTPAFEQAHPTIKVSVEPLPDVDTATKIYALAAAGTLGDVLAISAASGLPHQLALRKVTADFDALIKRDGVDLSQWYAPLVEGARVDGRQIAMIFNGKMGRVAVFYNTSLFDQAGLKVPDVSWTTDRVMEAAVKLTRESETDQQWGLAAHFRRDQSYLIPYVRRWNAELFDKTGAKATLDTPQALAAFQWAYDMYHTRRVAPVAGDEVRLFASGRGAMLLHGDFLLKNVITAASKTQGFEYGATFGPRGPGGRAGGLWTFRGAVMNAQTTVRDAAWLMTQFYCDKESGVALALQSAPGTQTTGGGRPDVYGDPRLLNHPSAPRSVQEAEAASNRTTEPYALPANYRADEISGAVNPFIDRIAQNEAQPTPSFMREANAAVQRVLDLPRQS